MLIQLLCAIAQVLEDLDVGHIPMISVWNKVDICADPEMVQTVADKRDNTVCISAQTGEGLPDLMSLVQQKIEESMMPVNVLVPYAQVCVAFSGYTPMTISVLCLGFKVPALHVLCCTHCIQQPRMKDVHLFDNPC